MNNESNSRVTQNSGGQYEYRAGTFFLLTFVVSWIPWFIAAYFSYDESLRPYYGLLFFLGGFGPTIGSLAMLWASKSRSLRRDFWNRLLDPRKFSLPYLPVTLFSIPALFIVSAIISEHYGAPANQLDVASSALAWLPVLFLAPTFEEIGWHGYGVDALRSKLGMLSATLVFGVLWALWHAPLMFINHSYQHDLWVMGPAYVINFFVSVMPIAVIANWLYYKHNRLILAAILLHFTADATPLMLNVQQFAKFILTGVMIVIAVLIVVFDRRTFSQGPRNFLGNDAAVPD